jgi:hypothetical protein
MTDKLEMMASTIDGVDPVVEQYDDGTAIVRPYYEDGGDESDMNAVEYRDDDGEVLYRTSKVGRNWADDRSEQHKTPERRAKTYRQLSRQIPRLDAEPPTDDGEPTIPVPVATEGNAAIAAYLYTAYEMPVDEIAAIHRMDLDTSTVSQYLSDLRAGRR